MVKVNGPMFSLDASGTLADAITFAKWKGRFYVRERVIPSNPRSGAQTGRRAMFKFLTQSWSGIATTPQASWQTLADQLVASPFNAYLSTNMTRWNNFLAPGQGSPVAESDSASNRLLSAAVWEENRVKISSTCVTANSQWGMVIFASLTTAFTPSVGTAIIGELDQDLLAHDTFWTPPSVDTWYFNSRAFSVDGTLAAAAGEVSAVPP